VEQVNPVHSELVSNRGIRVSLNRHVLTFEVVGDPLVVEVKKLLPEARGYAIQVTLRSPFSKR
jgi:hypothetical protein